VAIRANCSAVPHDGDDLIHAMGFCLDQKNLLWRRVMAYPSMTSSGSLSSARCALKALMTAFRLGLTLKLALRPPRARLQKASANGDADPRPTLARDGAHDELL
jgi:hypothetical protein